MASYLLQEDGSKIALEDGTGFIILEEDGAAPVVNPSAPNFLRRLHLLERAQGDRGFGWRQGLAVIGAFFLPPA